VFGAALAKKYTTGQAAFQAIDDSSDGVIDAAELAAAAARFRYQGQSADLFTDIDTSGDARITASEMTKFAHDYFPRAAAAIDDPANHVSWSPGYAGQFDEKRDLPSTAAHRRRTLGGLSPTMGKIGIGPTSEVLWMRLGRTTNLLPVAWIGEYSELGDGECRTMEAHTPVFVDLYNTEEGVCQGKCDTAIACYGFSWSSDGNVCRIWKESGLRGGGPTWGGCKCKVKVFDIVREPVISSGLYARMGDGKCLAGAGKDYPESVFHQDVDENYCRSRCTTSTECFGYTHTPAKHCYLWKLTDLRAPTAGTIGTTGESCMMKISKIQQSPTGEGVAEPPNAAPMLGPYDVGTPNVHAMKFPIGRSMSSVPVAWDGEWKTQPPSVGRCMTSSAGEPTHRIHPNVDAATCQAECAKDFSCYGYSWASTGQCLVWMQPDLWGGGPKDNGFSCVVKQFAVLTAPVVSSGKFTMAGPGLCKTAWDTNPASAYLGKVERSTCRLSCEDDSTCTGFSWEPSGECAVHYEAGLRSSRTTYTGAIACYVKDYQQALGVESGGTYAALGSGPQVPPVTPVPKGMSPSMSVVPAQQYGMSPGAITALSAPVAIGDRTLAVATNVGFQRGRQVIIDQGSQQEETNIIAGLGSIILQYPLKYAHPAGVAVTMPQGAPAQPASGVSSPQSNFAATPAPQGNAWNNLGVPAAAGAAGGVLGGLVGGNNNANGNTKGGGGHSNAALLGTALAGAGAVMGWHHMNGGGATSNNANQAPVATGQARAFVGTSSENGENAETNSNAPFVFWTPHDPGSATCQSDKPKRGFPGTTPQTSNSFWPSGHQPQNLECWHKEENGALNACWYTKVLFSRDRGWPGKCQGLLQVNTNGKSCEETCLENEECPVWQTFWEGKNNLVCMQGRGRDCAGMRHHDNSINIDQAQRIQHGDIRVLMSLKGMEIRNLRQDFDAGYYTVTSDATEACSFMCYSDIHCQYWVYSSTEGCFLEDPPMHAVAYPLTQADVSHNSAFAKSVVAGEYILHRCPENDGTFTSNDINNNFTLLPWEWNWSAFHWPWDEGGWPWWGWLLFSVSFCCCCGCLLVCFALCCGISIIKGRVSAGQASKTAPKGGDGDSDSESSSDSDIERKRQLLKDPK
jgi:hypothetical protein